MLAGERLMVHKKHREGGTPDANSESPGQSLSNQAAPTTGTSPNPESMCYGGFGEVWDATDEQGHPASPAEKRRQEHEWSIAAEQALRSAKACGHEPAGIE